MCMFKFVYLICIYYTSIPYSGNYKKANDMKIVNGIVWKFLNRYIKNAIDCIIVSLFLRKSITYANSFKDIVALVESSVSCRQFTKISCYAMLIFTKDGNQYGALIDRNDIVMEYFGGGPVDGRGKKNTKYYPDENQ